MSKNKNKTKTLSTLLMGLFASSAWAVPYALHTQQTAATAVPQTHATADTQMWNLQDANIRAVIQMVAQLTGKNFIVDPRVQGNVTLVSAKPMTTTEMYHAFLSMLQVLNYAAIPTGNNNTYKIIPAMDAKGYGGTLVNNAHPGSGDQVVVRVVPVNNVSALQLVSILQPLMLNWGSVSAYQPSNAVVLAGSAADVNQLVQIIHRLDQDNGTTVQVVHLKYADANKLAQVIDTLQSTNSNQGKINNASVVADATDNALLVSGNRATRARMIKLIKQLDIPNAAVGNNTAVVHLNYLTAKKLAPILMKLAQGYVQQVKNKIGNTASAQSSYGVSSSDGFGKQVSVEAIPAANAIVLSGPHQIIQSLEAVIKKIDTRPQEVLVQAIIVKINESDMSKLGIQWGMGDPTGGAGVLNQAFQNGVGFIRDGSFSAIVTALEADGNTDILATPSILVLNNQKALISDGKNIGVYNRQYSTSTTTAATDSTIPYNTYDRKDVALSLNVTPQIAPDNTVKLVIKQKDDSLAQDAQNQDPNNPVINTSKIDTSVLVNSGDVLVLGGLISNNNIESEQKIPILGDIPLLGRLFQYKTHSLEKSNLLVFIRPIIINNKKQAQQQSMKQYNYIRYQQMRSRDGMGLTTADQYPIVPYDHSVPSIQLPPPF